MKKYKNQFDFSKGKKIISYEEGELRAGYTYSKSRIALILVSSVSAGSSIETWILCLFTNHCVLVSSDIFGAALFRSINYKDSLFLCFIHKKKNNNEHPSFKFYLTILQILESNSARDIDRKPLVEFPLGSLFSEESSLLEPVIAMGLTPPYLILYLEDIIVVAVRSNGNITAFKYKSCILELLGQQNLNHFIIDAIICYENIKNSKIAVILLLTDSKNTKDGKIRKIYFNL